MAARNEYVRAPVEGYADTGTMSAAGPYRDGEPEKQVLLAPVYDEESNVPREENASGRNKHEYRSRVMLVVSRGILLFTVALLAIGFGARQVKMRCGTSQQTDPSPSSNASQLSRHVRRQDPVSPVSRRFAVGASTPDKPIIWDLHDDSTLSWIEPGGEWHTYEGELFNTSPVVASTADDAGTNFAFAVANANSWIGSLEYHDGAWDDTWWIETHEEATTRPETVARAGLIDLLYLEENGRLRHLTFDHYGLGASAELGYIFGEFAVVATGDDRVDVVAADFRGGFKHQYCTAEYSPSACSWKDDWELLGNPSGRDYDDADTQTHWPYLVSLGDGRLDLLVVMDGPLGHNVHHKLYSNGTWDAEWKIVPASHEGYELGNTQAIVKGEGPDELAYFFSRGTDNCIHYTTFNGTDWGFWDIISCLPRSVDGVPYLTEDLPVEAFDRGNGIIDVVTKNVTGEILHFPMSIPVGESLHDTEPVWESLGKAK